MINEIVVMNNLKRVIERQLNNYTSSAVETIDDKNVVIDFPAVDTMPKKNMIYIQPNYAEYNSLTTNSDDSQFNIALFIVCKRDKAESLTEKVFEYYNSLYKLFRTNLTLDETVDFIEIESFDYYPQVEANRNVVGIEMNVSCRYTKDFWYFN